MYIIKNKKNNEEKGPYNLPQVISPMIWFTQPPVDTTTDPLKLRASVFCCKI